MTAYGQHEKFSILAGASWPSAQYFGVTNAGAPAAVGLTFFGVQQNKCNTGEHLAVAVQGESKVITGSGGLAAGDLITPVTSGYFTKASSGAYAVGRCLTAAASGLIGAAYLFGCPTYVNS